MSIESRGETFFFLIKDEKISKSSNTIKFHKVRKGIIIQIKYKLNKGSCRFMSNQKRKKKSKRWPKAKIKLEKRQNK